MNGMEKNSELEMILLTPLVKPGRGYNIMMLVLVVAVAWGVFAWIEQLRNGMIVTGMRDQVFWGMNIANYVFFMNLSLAGTLLSALMRILRYKWQAPISRIAEVVTAAALLNAVAMMITNIGRPDRLFNMLIYRQFQSPLTWGIITVALYFFGSLIYLYLLLIPDLALCRDRLENQIPSTRYKVYSALSLNWQNTHAQKKLLERTTDIIAFIIIPVAFLVQYITAWIFSETLRPGWTITILAPYFLVSGFASSLAMVTILMTLFRKLFFFDKHAALEETYHKLGWLLLGAIVVLAYFSFNELLPGAYKMKGNEDELLTILFLGVQSSPFWSSIIGSMVVPALLVCWPRTRTATGLTAAAILVTIGMWINKSYLFVVATLQVPLMPFYELGWYNPTWTEWSINLAGLACFLLLILVFFRFFPLVTLWKLDYARVDKKRPHVFGKTKNQTSPL